MIKNRHIVYIITLFLLTSCSSDKGSPDRSQDLYLEQNDSVKEEIRSFWNNYREAQKLRTAGHWDEAKEFYYKALEIDSCHEDAWFNLGNTCLELGDYSRAKSCMKKITEMNPNSARAHMQLGRIYLSYEHAEIFDIDSAKKEFLTTSRINKIVTGPLMFLGHIALIEKSNELAYSYFQSVTQTDIRNSEAFFLLGYLEWKNNHSDKCRDLFEKAIKLSAPEKKIKGVFSEGDTEGGTSYLRPVNESIFYRFFKDLNQLEIQSINIPDEINTRYQKVDSLMNVIRNKMSSDRFLLPSKHPG
jgi:tetratricopeptide (TPR) repeat protein